MEWLFILALAAVAVWQARLIGALSQRVAGLEKLLAAREAEAAQETEPVEQMQRPASASTHAETTEELLLTQPLPAEIREPLLLDQPIVEDELLLDTPLPEASNDDAPPAPPPVEPEHAPPARQSGPRAREFRFDQWLAEKGFAWIAGGALALGAIFLVSFAAQQRWFTPQVQLAAAIAFALVLLGVSEWARRVSLRNPPGHPLIAALLAGAGVVALYATAWAAHGLYNFIDFGAAGALLALCAALLIGLSFLHGQPIGVLAVFAALLTPPLTHTQLWPSPALTLYIALVGVAGFGLAGLRRWGWVALATFAGLYFWFWAAIGANEIRRALALLSFASTAPVVMAWLRQPLPDASNDPLDWRRVHALGPTLGIAISSVFLIYAWPMVAIVAGGRIAGPALIGVFHIALAAYAVRGRVANAPALMIAILALVVGFIAYLQTRFYLGPLGDDFYPVLLTAALAVVVCAVAARAHREWRVPTAATGAIGAALSFALAASTRRDWSALAAWAPLFAGALVLFAAAWLASRDAAPRTDRVIWLWAGAGAVLVLLGVEGAFPSTSRAAAHASAALMFASAFAWRGWSVFRFAALTAAAITLAHALSPALFGAALSGEIPIWGALVILLVAATLLFGAAYFATAEPRSPYGEALSAAGVVTILIGAFLLLRWLASGTAAPLDAFTEAALRVIALMAAGHVVMARPGQDVGRIGLWRGHVLLGLGLLYTLLVPALAINPWWGAPPAPVSGPPLLDSLTLAFAAPAALSLWAARRLYLTQRTLARIYAIAGGALALLWVVLEVRRAAHGVDMAAAPVGLLEGAGYALVVLAAALGVAMFARQRAVKHADGPFTQDLLHAMRAIAGVALAVAILLVLVVRHPWWGAHDWTTTGPLQTGLAVLAQLGAAGISLALGRALSLSQQRELSRFAAAAAALVFVWSFGHAAIRWAYHQGAMDDGGGFAGLEGFAHALWPLVFVTTGAWLTMRAPGRDTVRAYLYDLQALWAAAVWPALGFAALGLWVLFNPWWGENPASIANSISALAALLTLIGAAWLSSRAEQVPALHWPDQFARAAIISCIGHLLVAATLAVRWLHHGSAMSSAPSGEVELWIYSAVWALFGATTFVLGLRRSDGLVRWSGLVILLLTTAYVFLLIFTQLTGFIRALTAIGLAAVLFAVAWLARTYRPGPKPTDLVNVTPGARREKRYGRRQRSQ